MQELWLVRLFRLPRFEDAERAGMEAAKNWVELFKRGGPFPLAIVPSRPVLYVKPGKNRM